MELNPLSQAILEMYRQPSGQRKNLEHCCPLDWLSELEAGFKRGWNETRDALTVGHSFPDDKASLWDHAHQCALKLKVHTILCGDWEKGFVLGSRACRAVDFHTRPLITKSTTPLALSPTDIIREIEAVIDIQIKRLSDLHKAAINQLECTTLKAVADFAEEALRTASLKSKTRRRLLEEGLDKARSTFFQSVHSINQSQALSMSNLRAAVLDRAHIAIADGAITVLDPSSQQLHPVTEPKSINSCESVGHLETDSVSSVSSVSSPTHHVDVGPHQSRNKDDTSSEKTALKIVKEREVELVEIKKELAENKASNEAIKNTLVSLKESIDQINRENSQSSCSSRTYDTFHSNSNLDNQPNLRDIMSYARSAPIPLPHFHPSDYSPYGRLSCPFDFGNIHRPTYGHAPSEMVAGPNNRFSSQPIVNHPIGSAPKSVSPSPPFAHPRPMPIPTQLPPPMHLWGKHVWSPATTSAQIPLNPPRSAATTAIPPIAISNSAPSLSPLSLSPEYYLWAAPRYSDNTLLPACVPPVSPLTSNATVTFTGNPDPIINQTTSVLAASSSDKTLATDKIITNTDSNIEALAAAIKKETRIAELQKELYSIEGLNEYGMRPWPKEYPVYWEGAGIF